MNKLNLKYGIVAAILIATISTFKASAQKTPTVKLQHDTKVEVFHELYDGQNLIYEVNLSFELKQLGDMEIIDFEIQLPSIFIQQIKYEYMFLFSETESRDKLFTKINRTPGAQIGASHYAPPEISRFYYATDSEKEVLTLLEPFVSHHESFRVHPMQIDQTMRFGVHENLAEPLIELTLFIYYGTKNKLHGAFNEARLKLELPEKELSTLPRTDCAAIGDKYNTKLHQLSPAYKLETIITRYNKISDRSEKLELDNVLSTIKVYLKYLFELRQLKNTIEADGVLDDCMELRSTLLRTITDITATESQLIQYQSDLQSRLQTINHCESLLSNERRRLDNLVKKLKDSKHQEEISSLQESIHNLNLDVAQNEMIDVNEALRSYEDQTNKLINSVGSIMNEFNQMRDRIKLMDAQNCRTEFNNIFSEIEVFDSKATNQLQELSKLNEIINKKLNLTNPQRLSAIHSLREQFLPRFVIIKNRLQDILKDVEAIDKRLKSFQDNGATFYASNRRSMLNEVEALFNKLDTQDSSFKSSIQLLSSESNATIGSHQTANIANETIDTIQHLKYHIESELYRLQRAIDVTPIKNTPVFMLVLLLIIITILFFGAYVYFVTFKKYNLFLLPGLLFTSRNKSPQKINRSMVEEALRNETTSHNQHRSAKVGGVTIRPRYADSTKAQLVHKGRGLDHVLNEEGKRNYYLVDLGDIWEDSMVRQVYIKRSCIKKTYKFFYESCVAENKVLETGGYMVGFWDYNTEDPGRYNVSMEDFIEPGDDAIYGEYQLNFGAKIGVRLDKVIRNYKEKTGRDMILTAWFHSHPGMRLFLSNHDLDVQERITNDVHKQKLLAFVIDPNTQENGKSVFSTGIFSYKSNRLMNNNDGNMKQIKWKDLYDWALSPVLPDFDSYFRIDMQTICSKSKVNTIYFNDQSIIRFSLFLDEHINTQNSVGFFAGEYIDDKQEKKRIAVLKDFKPKLADTDGQDIVACFISGKVDDKTLQSVPTFEKNNIEILLLCENKSRGLYILTKKSIKVFNSIADVKSTVSFNKLESWPTRRR